MTDRLINLAPRILPRKAAAAYCGFKEATEAFDRFAREMGFRKLPARRGCYDRKQIDAALDANMGLVEEATDNAVKSWLDEHGKS